MSDTFDRLAALRNPRRIEDPARGTIFVEAIDPFRSFNRYVCPIRIDGRRVAILSLFRSKVSFEANAGDHEMTAQLGPDHAGPLSIHLEPGGRIELACGKKPEWIQWERRITRRVVFLSLVCYGMMAAGWFGYPLLRGIVVEAIYRFDLQGGVAALGHKLVLSRWITAFVAY